MCISRNVGAVTSHCCQPSKPVGLDGASNRFHVKSESVIELIGRFFFKDCGNKVPYSMGEPERKFGLTAIATRNCLLRGTTESSTEVGNSSIYRSSFRNAPQIMFSFLSLIRIAI
jgi:hypothetical protein